MRRSLPKVGKASMTCGEGQTEAPVRMRRADRIQAPARSMGGCAYICKEYRLAARYLRVLFSPCFPCISPTPRRSDETVLLVRRLFAGAAYRAAGNRACLRTRKSRHPEQKNRIGCGFLADQSQGLRAGAATGRRHGAHRSRRHPAVSGGPETRRGSCTGRRHDGPLSTDGMAQLRCDRSA